MEKEDEIIDPAIVAGQAVAWILEGHDNDDQEIDPDLFIVDVTAEDVVAAATAVAAEPAAVADEGKIEAEGFAEE